MGFNITRSIFPSRDGILKKDSIRTFNVNFLVEAGLLGITRSEFQEGFVSDPDDCLEGTSAKAITTELFQCIDDVTGENKTVDYTVYLYLTESETMGGEAIANRIYKFSWDGERLKNEKLVNELPVHVERLQHNGGSMVTSPDGNVFAVIGDTHREGPLKNFETGEIDDSGIIFHVGLEKSIIKPSESEDPISHYYAMGIRNSFGLAFDPITGNLWDTENGHTTFDEVNFVPPKFNSGWKKIMGPSTQDQRDSLPGFDEFQYSDPEFSWEHTIAPTGLTFVNSDLFEHYKDSLFVADYLTGSIYKFKLNSERDGFVFDDERLSDLVLNTSDPPNEIIFASGFQGITDLEFGPDGLLYVLSPSGTIHKISPEVETKKVFQPSFPNWLKNNGKWWNEDKIGDREFVNAIGFLIQQNIIDLPIKSHSLIETLEDIPPKVKTDTGKWANNELTDEEFFPSLKFLIDKNLIKIIKQSCNDVRGFGVDLSGCDLSGIDLSDKDLRGAKFTNANLTNSVFSNTDLGSAQMEMAIITNSKISNSNFQLANLNHANLENSVITDSNLNFVQFEGANLNGTDLSNSDLSKSNLIDAFISNAKLTKTNLSFSHLDNAIITNSNLANSNFFITYLYNANLENTNLSNSKFEFARLQGANLKGADLSQSYLFATRLANADLSYANLSGADLTKANLTNANLSEANLMNANLEDAKLIGTNLTNANLEGSKIENADFTGADMKGCVGCP